MCLLFFIIIHVYRATPLNFFYSDNVKIKTPFFYISRFFWEEMHQFLNFEDMRSWLKSLPNFTFLERWCVPRKSEQAGIYILLSHSFISLYLIAFANTWTCSRWIQKYNHRHIWTVNWQLSGSAVTGRSSYPYYISHEYKSSICSLNSQRYRDA